MSITAQDRWVSFLSMDEFDDEWFGIVAGAYNPNFKKFIVKVGKKDFEKDVGLMKKKIEENVDDDGLVKDDIVTQSVGVLCSIIKCLNEWVDKVDELEKCATENNQDWNDFCVDIYLYYVHMNALFGDVIPITRI